MLEDVQRFWWRAIRVAWGLVAALSVVVGASLAKIAPAMSLPVTLGAATLLLTVAGAQLERRERVREVVNLDVVPTPGSPTVYDLIQIVLHVTNVGPTSTFNAHVRSVDGLHRSFPWTPYGGFDLQWVDEHAAETNINGAGGVRGLRIGTWDNSAFAFRFRLPDGGDGVAITPTTEPLRIELEIHDTERGIGRLFSVSIAFEKDLMPAVSVQPHTAPR